MPELIAKPAYEAAPLTVAGLVLAVENPGPITMIAPWPGQEKPLAKLLKPLGLGFPAAGACSARGDALLAWVGRGQAALIGVTAPEGLSAVAAVTDQSDGWVCLSLSGPQAGEALMRLVALDLRADRFAAGRVARAALNHMPLILIKRGDGFLILTFRSMARTAWHELATVLGHVEARARLAMLG